jgi:hypothetical protein
MIERVPIRSARQDNRIFGFIESNKAFDLLGRSCADYDPKTGLLCRDGSVVGYVTLEGKFLGSSEVAQKLFPETYEATSDESPRSYVNNIANVLDVAEQQPSSADAGFDDPEVTSGPRVIAVKSPAVSVEDRLPDSVKEVVGEPFAQEQQSTEHSEMADPETPLTIPTKHAEEPLHLRASEEELVAVAVDCRDKVSQESEAPSCLSTAQHLDSENDSSGGNRQAQSESLTEHEGSAPRASENSDADKATKNKCQTGDARVLETVAAFMHRVAAYVGSADNDQRESPSPFLDEGGKLKAELSEDAEASPTEKQDERTDEAVFEDGDGVLKAPGSHDQAGTMAFDEERLCEGGRVSVGPAHENTETIDLEDEGVEVRFDKSYDKEYDTVRGTSPESPLRRDEEVQARSDPIVSDLKPSDLHTVAEGLDGSFEFLRKMRSVSWLDSSPRDFSSSEDNALEELKLLLKQLEK